MNWANELFELYEKNASLAGFGVGNTTLLPLSHSTAKAQIEVKQLCPTW